MAKTTVIYGLIDPRTQQLRYVGKTTRLLPYRLKNHVTRTNLMPKRHSSRWIAGLVKEGLLPEIFTIEEVPPGGDWVEAEKFWIAYFRSIGADLTNITDGGDGVAGYRFPDERRQYLSMKFKGRQFDEEWRSKISAAKQGTRPGRLDAEAEARRVAKMKATRRRKALARTHCDVGHELSGDNLLIRERDTHWKGCKICSTAKKRAYYLRVRPPLKTPEELAEMWAEQGLRRRMRNPNFDPTAPVRRYVGPGYRYGEKHQNSKLTWDDVDAIRRRVASGESRRAVGAEFGIALTTVDQIIQGKCWKPEHRPVVASSLAKPLAH